MLTHFVFCLIIFISTSVVPLSRTNAQSIHVASQHCHKGETDYVSIANCTNLPPDIAGDLSSVDTGGKCARLYDKVGCEGNSIEILARSPSHFDLKGWGFDDKAMSVGACPHACHPSVTGPAPKEPLELEIFGRRNFKGPSATIKVRGCTLIPPGFRELSSVKTSGTCFQLYNNVECKTTGKGVDTIELRPGTPAHDDIGRWSFYNARAVSHCSYKCNDTESRFKFTWVLPELEADEVLLFDSKEYKGNWIKVRVRTCVNLTSEWEGSAESAMISDEPGTCVMLFDRQSCKGESVTVTSSQDDLSDQSFEGSARSLQPCTQSSLASKSSGIISTSYDVNKIEILHRTATEGVSPSTGNVAVIVISSLAGIILFAVLVMMVLKKYNLRRMMYGNRDLLNNSDY